MIQVNLFTKQKQTHRLKKQTYGCQKGNVEGVDKSRAWDELTHTTIYKINNQQFQGTLKSLLQPQFKSISSQVLSLLYGPSLTSIYPFMTTGKTVSLTIWTFVGKVISLLFNMLSRFVIVILPRSKKLVQMILFPKQKQTTKQNRRIENKRMDTKREEGGGVNWGIGIGIYMLSIL